MEAAAPAAWRAIEPQFSKYTGRYVGMIQCGNEQETCHTNHGRRDAREYKTSVGTHKTAEAALKCADRAARKLNHQRGEAVRP